MNTKLVIKVFLISFLIIIISIVGIISISAATESDNDIIINGNLTGSVEFIKYNIDEIGTEQKALVYTPPGYTESNKYEVLMYYNIDIDSYKDFNFDINLDNLYNKIMSPILCIVPYKKEDVDINSQYKFPAELVSCIESNYSVSSKELNWIETFLIDDTKDFSLEIQALYEFLEAIFKEKSETTVVPSSENTTVPVTTDKIVIITKTEATTNTSDVKTVPVTDNAVKTNDIDINTPEKTSINTTTNNTNRVRTTSNASKNATSNDSEPVEDKSIDEDVSSSGEETNADEIDEDFDVDSNSFDGILIRMMIL